MLVGRDVERAVIGRLLDDARAGAGGGLLLEGDPGIGKTALLEAAVAEADGLTVIRVTGVESEAELEFSGLLDLCRPLLSLASDLPPPQAAALRGALGLEAQTSRDRFAIGAATLALLAQAASGSPLLVVVDDAQWVDTASVDALCFAARRLRGDAVAFLTAARSGEVPAPLAAVGFPGLTLDGLDAEAAGQLVARAGTPAAVDVARRLAEVTGGNALALAELARALSDAQLAGSDDLPDPLPVGRSTETAYGARLAGLSPATRQACVLLALGADDDEAVSRALELAGLPSTALEEAEDAGLVHVDAAGAGFRHPLVRSAVVQAAKPSERRAAHRVLAEALAVTGRRERRAWHLAAATVGPDAEVADALAAAAELARGRTGFGSASRGFERAARITPDSALRRRRLADAAESAFGAGERTRAIALAEEALAGCDDRRLEALLLRLLGRIELQTGEQPRARELLVASADAAAAVDADLSVGALSLAVFACHFGGEIGESLELARRARAFAPHDRSIADEQSDYALGRSLLLAGHYEDGRLLLEALVARWLDEHDQPRIMLARTATALALLDRDDEAVVVGARVERAAREEGPMTLVYALLQTAEAAVRAGRWADAVRAGEEARELAHELRQDNVTAHVLAALARVAAGRGDETLCVDAAERALASLDAGRMGLAAAHVRSSLGLLALGLDRLEAAVQALEPVTAATLGMRLVDPDVCPAADLVEALVRLGRADDAASVLASWEAAAPHEAPWLQARLDRCRGLLANEDGFEARFDASLGADRGTDAFARARTALCFGERLRRAGRRVDSRRQLRDALETFERLHAAPWVERATRELRATGEKVGRRRAERGDELTAQELQIALQVAEGKQNKEVAAALFLSPKTVEFHLGRIYRKLDVSSRSELVRRFATASPPGA